MFLRKKISSTESRISRLDLFFRNTREDRIFPRRRNSIKQKSNPPAFVSKRRCILFHHPLRLLPSHAHGSLRRTLLLRSRMDAAHAVGEAISNSLTDDATQHRHVVAMMHATPYTARTTHLVGHGVGMRHLISGRRFTPTVSTLMSTGSCCSSTIGTPLVRVLKRGWLRSSTPSSFVGAISTAATSILTSRISTGTTVPSGLRTGDTTSGPGPLLLDQHGILWTISHDVDDAPAEVANFLHIRRGKCRRNRRAVVHPSLQLELVTVLSEK